MPMLRLRLAKLLDTHTERSEVQDQDQMRPISNSINLQLD